MPSESGLEILLLSCYELGHQPLSLALSLAFLERAGFRPRAIDLSVEKLDPSRVRDADLVAIAVPMHTALRLGARAAERVRAANPRAHVCFFGLYAPLNERWLLEGKLADSVIGGEAEAQLVALAEALRDATPPARATTVLERLDFPVPSRAALPPLSRYAKLAIAGEERLAGHVEASRGCLHLCRHCPIPPVYGGRLFVVPKEVVLDDARRQIAAGARHITFGDPDFLNGPRHSLAIVRALHDEHPDVTWDATAKVEHLLHHAELLPELVRLGCLFVVSAVESIDDRVLAILDKGHTRADVKRALAVTRAAGLALRPTFVPFTPWTTLGGYLELLRFLDENALVDAIDPVQLSIRLLLPPGSLLLQHPETTPHLGALDPAALTVRWRHPDPRMDALQRRVYAIVDEAAKASVDPRVVFARAVAESYRAAGGDPPPLASPPRQRPARLTEAWFC